MSHITTLALYDWIYYAILMDLRTLVVALSSFISECSDIVHPTAIDTLEQMRYPDNKILNRI
jgi:hypothetical protein